LEDKDMASHAKFQSKTNKYGATNRTSSDAELTTHMSAKGKDDGDFISRNIDKLTELISFWRFYPDLFLDLITPETGGIKLHTDQRVYFRVIARFFSTYGVFPRGWGKTHGEVLIAILMCVFYPNMTIALTAQTKENAASILESKIKSEILRQYPLLENEIAKKSFSKNEAELVFQNGSILNVLANAQTSKGQRRVRLNIEESALLNNELFEDALKPIVEVPRYTCGRNSIVDPEEMNQQINFFTTAGWRGSDEFIRSLDMLDYMASCNGEFVIGSDWHLACWYGRGSTKAQVLQKKRTMTSVAFDQNYGSKWTGNTDSALVDIRKLLLSRVLSTYEKEAYIGYDYVLAVDVARSEGKSNNRSSIVVLKIEKSGKRITGISAVNIVNISNAMNYTGQAIEVKRTWKHFNKHNRCVACVVDDNGLGKGLTDELAKEHVDPITKDFYPCFNTFNTESITETRQSIDIVYALTAQSAQTDIITSFIDAVESGKLQLLIKKDNSDYGVEETVEDKICYINTDFLIEEIANLKLKTLPSGKLTLERIVRRVDKDKFSALAYGIWYIKTFMENVEEDTINKLDLLTQYTFV